MKTIKNHFEDKTTYIVGKLIVNGCQSFPIDKLDAVCRQFKVTKKMKNQVKELYYENGENENWEELLNHENWQIRAAVAEQGHCLNILINDKDSFVRAEVARQGYGLDILINDETWGVRYEVARQGYGLDKLINDKSWVVRAAVASQYYDLDILINDKDTYVRIIAAQKLQELQNNRNITNF